VLDFAKINGDALAVLPSLLKRWLPDGQASGDEWIARNPNRDDRSPGSFRMNMQSGKWADFATSDSGSDPISLVAYLMRLSQAEAAGTLDKETRTMNSMSFPFPAPPQFAEKRPICPVPSDAPPMRYRHKVFGAPTQAWPYHDAEGRLVAYMARFDTVDAAGQAKKDYLPITYCEMESGKHAWVAKGIPEPRPLYRVHEIAARSAAPVIVAEGEKAADAAELLFPEMVATTPAHGAKSPHKSDWSAVANRWVIVITDNDEAGEGFGKRVSELALNAGAICVSHVPPDRLGSWVWRNGHKFARSGEIPKSWDIANALEEGWTADAVRTAMADPSFFSTFPTELKAVPPPVAIEKPDGWPFRLTPNGVEKRVEHTDKLSGTVTIEWRWFCSRLEVAAETRSSDGEDWGRLLHIMDRDGQSKRWAMPMSLLAGDGTAYRERLLSLGLTMAPGSFARDALHSYISTARPEDKARCVARIGWHGRVFVGMKINFGDGSNG
jgi:hypothetical protein